MDRQTYREEKKFLEQEKARKQDQQQHAGRKCSLTRGISGLTLKEIVLNVKS
ncbi:hypothetical protein [Peribacillus muralis]|uniref:hypothetical protein n=1 Tax=Peribacillus muralis TaxID=264697 RepID=UPI0036729EBE